MRTKPDPDDEVLCRRLTPGDGTRAVRMEASMELIRDRDDADLQSPAASQLGPVSRRRRGQSLVELALALPVLLLLMLGTIDLGRMFFNYIELRNAVREGAAYLARNPTDTAGAWSRVTSHGGLVASAVPDPAPTAGSGCTTPGGTGTAVVSAKLTFTPITTGFVASVPLSASATMRCLT
jgi:hypothetical protein